MVANRGVDTAPEVALRSELHRQGLRFRKHIAPLKGLRCRADVVFPSSKVAVFVDGCFWHCCPEHATFPKANASWWRLKLAQNVERDQRNNEALAKAGWMVIRIWEHENPRLAAELIARAVAERANPR
jgi:DNA mismatch endonuclease (patch repair protein)